MKHSPKHFNSSHLYEKSNSFNFESIRKQSNMSEVSQINTAGLSYNSNLLRSLERIMETERKVVIYFYLFKALLNVS